MRKDINFYTGLKDIKVKQAISPVVILLGLLIMASVVLLGLGYNGISILNQMVYSEADAVHKYLADPENQAMAQDTLKMQATQGLYNQYADITRKSYNDYYTLPFLDSAAFKKITAALPADVKFLSFTAGNGSLEMECQCKKETSPAAFVNAVKNSELFVEVIYSGYTVGPRGKFCLPLPAGRSREIKFNTMIGFKLTVCSALINTSHTLAAEGWPNTERVGYSYELYLGQARTDYAFAAGVGGAVGAFGEISVNAFLRGYARQQAGAF